MQRPEEYENMERVSHVPDRISTGVALREFLQTELCFRDVHRMLCAASGYTRYKRSIVLFRYTCTGSPRNVLTCLFVLL